MFRVAPLALMALMPPAGAQEAPAPPYNIGLRFLRVPREGGKTLLISLWYPTAAKPDGSKYEMAAFAMQGDVAREAAPLPGPFPLVIYSHGGGACATSGAVHAEGLAAQGFVVAGPDHSDDFVAMRSDQPGLERGKVLEWLKWAHNLSAGKTRTRALHRPREVKATIDAVLAACQDPNSDLHGLVDPSRIGMTGVSFGAWTTLACAGYIPILRDKRIKAAAPIAGPAGEGKLVGDVRNVEVPLLIIFGEREHTILGDSSSPLKEPFVRQIYARANPPKVLVGISNAVHLHFGGAGAIGPGQRGGIVPSTAQVRREDAITRATNEYLVAFFRRYLCGDRAAEQRLTSRGPGVYLHAADLGG